MNEKIVASSGFEASKGDMEKDTDYRRNRDAFAQKIYEQPDMLPFRYVLILTNRCNLRCSFCFQEKSFIEGSLTAEDWLKVIGQLPDYAWVTLTGGEPLLFKEFERIFRAVTNRNKCNIISNGLLLDLAKIDLLLSEPNFRILSISVDDTKNASRGVRPEHWERAEEMLQEFASRRDKLGSETLLDTKTVVLDSNAQDLYEIHRYCMETLRADTHSFQLLKGAPIQHADRMFPMEAMFTETEAHVYRKFETIVEQFELVRQYNLKTGKKCFVHPRIADLNGAMPIREPDLAFINAAKHHKETFCACKAPWESVHINVDGNLFPCMAIKMGNVKTEGLKEIIHSPAFAQFKREIREQGTVAGCNRCGYLLPQSGSGVQAR